MGISEEGVRAGLIATVGDADAVFNALIDDLDQLHIPTVEGFLQGSIQ